MTVRDLVAGDAGWAAELMAARRQVYSTYSPVFWRPRPGVTARHAQFLEQQTQNPDNAALRNDHAFIIAQLRDREALVDDFAVDGDGTWADDGCELLTAAWARLRPRGVSAARVVTARADEPKVAMLVAAGLRLVQQWWVKPLNATPDAGAAHGRVERISFSATLGPAPPVYDPGGPVLLADRVAADVELSVIEHEAAQLGAVLAVIPAAPVSDLESALHDRGWTIASQWYLGQPH